MFVFVDESGDAGVRGKPGSSRYFIVTAIILDDQDELSQMGRTVDDVRESLGFPSTAEFKFNKSSRRVRCAFLEAIGACNFFYSSLVLNKEKLTGPGCKFKDSLYNYSASLLFMNLSPWLTSAMVVIDGSGSRLFRRQLSTYLRKRINEDPKAPKIKAVRIEASHKNNLLQAADMVCGAVARAYRMDKGDRPVYREVIRHRELSIRKWPR